MVTETVQVTIMLNPRTMSCNGVRTRLFFILCILLLQQVIKSYSIPINKFPERHKALEYEAHPKNLSEVIEYEPLHYPQRVTNLPASSDLKEQTSGRRVATFRLKTFLHVEGNQNISKSSAFREQKESDLNASKAVESAKEGNASVGLSLDRQTWNKRMFVRAKIEPNETSISLDGVEYIPGESLSHVLEMQGQWPHQNEKDSPYVEPTSDETQTKQIGLSLSDEGWQKTPYVRGIVKRNESKASSRDIQYVPGEISMDIPGGWFNMWMDRKEQDETEPNDDDEYSSRKESNNWEIKLLGSTESESRKSSRVGSDDDYTDSSEDSGEYWFGPGKVEKLHYSNGEKTWKEFQGKRKLLTNVRFWRNKETSSDRKAREAYRLSNIPKTSRSSNSDEVSENIEFTYDSNENHNRKIVEKDLSRSNAAKSRQFVFHPYLPYGKDVPADEKIKFGDILPFRMVKFVKSMVEDAPWEQMFIKMVRMVVDQFVDKIIEKMFAEKGDEHLKKRSDEIILGDAWELPSFVRTHVLRMKRAVGVKMQPQHVDNVFSRFPEKQDPQSIEGEGKKEEDDKTWLDHFLDFLFPNSKSNIPADPDKERLTKRDTDNAHLFRIFVSHFVNYFEKTSEVITDAKDVLRYKMLKDILPYLYQKRLRILDTPENTPSPIETLKMSPRDVLDEFRSRNDVLENTPRVLVRNKRSTEESEWKKDETKLWQEGSRRHKPHHRRVRNDCSLRRACTTGRLLSRLPAVEEITLQLKSQGNEPHWDAMIWGMKKKRCSRIFCKRQRSPKGSRRAWSEDKDRPSRKLEIVTEPPNEMDGDANLTR